MPTIFAVIAIFHSQQLRT